MRALPREACIGLTIAEFNRRNLSERIDWTGHWPVIERRGTGVTGRRRGWRIIGVYDSASLEIEGCVPVHASHNGRRVTLADDEAAAYGVDWFTTARAAKWECWGRAAQGGAA
jgi:hypothetical protein